ncbi:helix-turn-helix transcriptional regulator [Streptomyces sp. HUAS TT7]|uniref:helix-turn-helix transcriptional regulator n=1 Tax=Streptomyces sp. HUAS TT7 TaxID=3447507 RepID=UPI003F65A63C
MLQLAISDEEFEIPDGFDLAGYWRRAQDDFHAWLRQDEAAVRLSPRGAERLTGAAARAFAETGTEEPDGWTRAVLPIESLDHAHGEFLALGAEIEVLAPAELQFQLADTIRQLAAVYAG